MARLNEPPAVPAATVAQVGTESVDVLKRRFIRQNRDLAKNNSEQNLRIRSLQIDIDRLLQANLELREEVIGLRKEVQSAQTQSSKDGLQKFKMEMAAKMRELSEMVEAMDDAPLSDEENEELVKIDRRRSALQRMDFRERRSLSEVMREHQMPTIAENARHSRGSLATDEINAVRLSDHSNNESPDLGPPPVARFECQDPIKFDTQAATTAGESLKSQEDEELPATLSVNLETRRKRKDGQSRLEIRRHSIIPPASPSGSDVAVIAPTLRTGAKRKLADRDLDKPVKAPGKTEFMFSRKSQVETAGNFSKQEAPKEEVAIPRLSPKTTRRVLGDKSANMSPKKVDTAPGKPEKDGLKKPTISKLDLAKDRVPRRSGLSQVPMPGAQQQEPLVASIAAPLSAAAEPGLQSLAAPDFFSPTPSEPSLRINENRDTPPPGDLSSLSNSTAASGIEGLRPSRRARAAVNYTEPSLTAKMRRPDKKMVDALTGLSDHRSVMSVSLPKKPAEGIEIKRELVDEDAWKTLPPSSISMAATKVTPLVLPGQGEAKSSSDPIIAPDAVQACPPRSDSGLATCLPTSEQTDDLDDAAKKLKELDLYEFQDSSSPSSVASAGSGTSVSAIRTSRRHSFIPKEASSVGGQDLPSMAMELQKPTRTTSRRRSMMV